MNQQEKRISEGILLNDQYQFTMAQLYYRMGLHEKMVQFDHFYRSNPNYGSHQAGFCINAGLEWLVDWMQSVSFGEEEAAVLRSHKSRTGGQMFSEDFLDWMKKNGNFSSISMRGVPEGRVVHPNEPLNVVVGPMAVAQILETGLLNHLNFQILIATKAARMREASRGQLIMEFGLRRAQERGGIAGARAAMIGGADYSSNVGVSHVLGYQAQGTHAHSMVQVFMALGEGEKAAFEAYADVYPDDCLLLVDTIDTLQSGVPHAIEVFEKLRAKGHEPIGIRLDSGDLAHLSIQAARMLDKAGFPDTRIVLSNQLNELVIWQIISQVMVEAPRYGLDADKLIKRLSYGVGTDLITSAGDAALDGVYKLVAVCKNNHWQPAIKISDTPEKTLNPGHKSVWRVYDQSNKAIADLVCLEDENPAEMDPLLLQHPSDMNKNRRLNRNQFSTVEPLHVDIFTEGKLVYDLPSLEEIRANRRADLERLYPGVERLVNPHNYHVSVTPKLWELKQSLIQKAF